MNVFPLCVLACLRHHNLALSSQHQIALLCNQWFTRVFLTSVNSFIACTNHHIFGITPMLKISIVLFADRVAYSGYSQRRMANQVSTFFVLFGHMFHLKELIFNKVLRHANNLLLRISYRSTTTFTIFKNK